jgi:putative SOS response-associated peptidase YedK
VKYHCLAMCGRIAQHTSSEEIARTFDATDRANSSGDRYNVAPTQLVLVVVEHAGARYVATHRWGIIPPWAPDERPRASMFNARAETIHERPAYRGPFRRQRCIVPADAFYEWQLRAGAKVPHAIVRQNGRPLALAGVWSVWKDPTKERRIVTCAIITTTPNETLRPLHDRMPIILPEDTWAAWLNPANRDVRALRDLLRPCPAEWLQAYPVASAVNSVRNDGAHLLAPLVRVRLDTVSLSETTAAADGQRCHRQAR